MFCTSCGAENKDSAAFCRKCGEAVGEEETRVAIRGGRVENHPVGEAPTPLVLAAEPASVAGTPQPRKEGSPDDEVIFSITPTLLFVKMGYAAAAVGALFFVALASAFAYLIVPIWLAILLGLGLFLIPAFYHIKQKLVRYTLTGSTLEVDEGLISRTTRRVPLRRIQDVTVSATVIQRLLGLGSVSIDNASDDGERITLANINSPRKYADKLLAEMKHSEAL